VLDKCKITINIEVKTNLTQNKLNIGDVFGAAVNDYFSKPSSSLSIKVVTQDIGTEKVPVEYLFRKPEKMPATEQVALSLCTGKVLDVGACAGAHAVVLQEKGFEVLALEQSEKCCEILKARGIKNVFHGRIEGFNNGKFDTILLLMNGIGIAGSTEGLVDWLLHLKSLLNENGQILLTSTDVSYLFMEEDGSILLDLSGSYFGELNYKISYKNEYQEFKWLFLDKDALSYYAEQAQFKIEFISEDEDGTFLAKLF